MKKLKKLIVEQGVFDALRSLVQPVTRAISDFEFPKTDRESQLAEDWDAISTEIQKFFAEFPEISPTTNEELASFEKWLKSNKRRLTKNNVKAALAKVYLGADLNFANNVHDLIKHLVKAYPEIVEQNEIESLTKKIITSAKGDIDKSKDDLLRFVLERLDKIAKWKLGLEDSSGMKPVEDPIDHNSILIAGSLKLTKDKVKARLSATLKKIKAIAKKAKERIDPLVNDLIDTVSKDYFTKNPDQKDNKEVVGKLRNFVIKYVKSESYWLDLSDEDEFDKAVKAIASRINKKGLDVTEGSTKIDRMTKILIDRIVKNAPPGVTFSDADTRNKLIPLVKKTLEISHQNGNIDIEEESVDEITKKLFRDLLVAAEKLVKK